MFPDLKVGVIHAQNINNSGSSSDVESKLNEQVESVRSDWDMDKLNSDERILAWREAYRAFKAKPKKYKCSVENLYRMIMDGINLSPINTVVDIYNISSLKHTIPVGGDDIDKIDGDVVLTIADGTEEFTQLNTDEAIAVKSGEIIYRDDKEVLCRRWNWRECDKSKMTADTKNVCLLTEAIPPVDSDKINEIVSELASNVSEYCGGEIETYIIDASNPVLEINS